MVIIQAQSLFIEKPSFHLAIIRAFESTIHNIALVSSIHVHPHPLAGHARTGKRIRAYLYKGDSYQCLYRLSGPSPLLINLFKLLRN